MRRSSPVETLLQGGPYAVFDDVTGDGSILEVFEPAASDGALGIDLAVTEKGRRGRHLARVALSAEEVEALIDELRRVLSVLRGL